MSAPERDGTRFAPHGLMMAMIRPPVGIDAEFNDWYDTEHAPARAAVPGFLTARRWLAVAGWDGGDRIDEAKAAAVRAAPPHYLATFDLDKVEVLDGDEYQAVRAGASERERELNTRFVENDRRVYRPVALPAAARDDIDLCAPYLLIDWWEHDDDPTPEVQKPYLIEHVRAAMATEGVRRMRLFERVDAGGPGRYAALYDLESLEAFRPVAGRPAPWLADAVVHQRDAQQRLYALLRRFDSPAP